MTQARLLLLLLYMQHSCGEHQRCAHDVVHEHLNTVYDHNLPERVSNLSYNHFIPHLLHRKRDHDAAQSSLRRQLVDSEYRPIRIVPYWTHLEQVLSNNPDDLQFIKQLVSASIRYISQFVYVVPVQNNLTLSHECQEETSIGCTNVINYNDYCHPDGFAVPQSHFSRFTLYNHDGNIQSEIGGEGVPDADFILYISADADEYCVSNVAAWGIYCATDQYGRPIAGFIHICRHLLESRDFNEDMDVVLHEIFHTLVMSEHLWFKFIDASFDVQQQNFVSPTDVFFKGYIRTPTVRSRAQQHYNCSSLEGMQYERGHWSATPLAFELMIGTNYNGLAYLSEFTLALMEDSGHYMVDYQYAHPSYSWGKDQGCAFAESTACYDKKTHKSLYPDAFCEQHTGSNIFMFDGCSFDSSAMTFCDVYQYPDGYIPTAYQWFANPDFGGHEGYNFCPIQQPQKNTDLTPYWRGYCVDTRGYELMQHYNLSDYGLQFGAQSKCLYAKDAEHGNAKFGGCYEIRCAEYDAQVKQWNAIYIVINGANDIYCARTDMKQWKTSAQNPILSLQCPDIDHMCVSSQPLQCVYGEWNDAYQRCLCHVGYSGDVCDVPDVQIIPNLQSAAAAIVVVVEDVANETPSPTLSPTATLNPICTSQPHLREIVFLVDVSCNVQPQECAMQSRLIQDLISTVKVDQDTAIAIVEFGDKQFVDLLLGFHQDQSRAHALNTSANITCYNDPGTSLTDGLRVARLQFELFGDTQVTDRKYVVINNCMDSYTDPCAADHGHLFYKGGNPSIESKIDLVVVNLVPQSGRSDIDPNLYMAECADHLYSIDPLSEDAVHNILDEFAIDVCGETAATDTPTQAQLPSQRPTRRLKTPRPTRRIKD